jgi:hypothetical protein
MGTITATAMTTGTVTITATVGNNGRVARKLRPTAFAMALTAWDVWRRLPPRQRRWVYKQVRHHGPRIAKQAYTAQQARKKR